MFKNHLNPPYQVQVALNINEEKFQAKITVMSQFGMDMLTFCYSKDPP